MLGFLLGIYLSISIFVYVLFLDCIERDNFKESTVGDLILYIMFFPAVICVILWEIFYKVFKKVLSIKIFKRK